MADNLIGVIPSVDEVPRIVQAVVGIEEKGYSRARALVQKDIYLRQQSKEAQLTSTLNEAGAGAPLSDSTTATFKFIESDSDNPGDVRLGEQEFTLVNRDSDLSGEDGDYVIVAFLNGEWRIMAKAEQVS